jgi:hypothetical protein
MVRFRFISRMAALAADHEDDPEETSSLPSEDE